jgi:hypothetical protein
VLLLCGVAAAQHSNGYVFIAPGAVTGGGESMSTLHFGGGGEAILGKGIGFAAEIGAIGPTRALGESIGAASLNGSFHFMRRKDRRVDPYVTAGYTLIFRSGTENLFNVGGGLNYWFANRLGLKVELRDHVMSECCGTAHFWGVRAGIAFRSGG